MDLVCPGGIARGVGEKFPEQVLVLPTISYGYTGHVMDFPGTINTHYETFIKQVLDVTKSLAFHGFRKIILLNGHGSNMPNLDLAARRTNLETESECILAGDDVRTDRVHNHISTLNDGNPYIWGDLLSKGPGALTSWTSSYSKRGVMGEPELATREKGEQIYVEAVKRLSGMVQFFRKRPKDVRKDHRVHPSATPMPWGQRNMSVPSPGE